MSTAAISLTALGIIGGAIALIGTVVFWLHRTHSKLADAISSNGDLRRKIDEWDASVKRHRKAVMDARDELGLELKARERIERQRNALLQKLIDTGDPDGIAAAINEELRDMTSPEDL